MTNLNVATLQRAVVVSIADGAKLGVVDELLFDPTRRCLAAVGVIAEGRHLVIPFDQVSALGADAVTVADRRSTEGYSELFVGLPNLDQLLQLKVVDEGGRLIGEIDSVEIDATSGQITQIHVHQGGVMGVGGHRTVIAADQIRGLGDVLVVAQMAGLSRQDAPSPAAPLAQRER